MRLLHRGATTRPTAVAAFERAPLPCEPHVSSDAAGPLGFILPIAFPCVPVSSLTERGNEKRSAQRTSGVRVWGCVGVGLSRLVVSSSDPPLLTSPSRRLRTVQSSVDGKAKMCPKGHSDWTGCHRGRLVAHGGTRSFTRHSVPLAGPSVFLVAVQEQMMRDSLSAATNRCRCREVLQF